MCSLSSLLAAFLLGLPHRLSQLSQHSGVGTEHLHLELIPHLEITRLLWRELDLDFVA